MEILQEEFMGVGSIDGNFTGMGEFSIDGNLTGGTIEIFTGELMHREFHRWKC